MRYRGATRINVKTGKRAEMIDVTLLVQREIDGKLSDGFVIVFVPHTTAAITINENADPDVKHDMLRKLETLVPKSEGYYRHAEGNSDAHVKTSLVGNSVTVVVSNGKLDLGKWQGIQFCEFDGPRDRELYVKIMRMDESRTD